MVVCLLVGICIPEVAFPRLQRVDRGQVCSEPDTRRGDDLRDRGVPQHDVPERPGLGHNHRIARTESAPDPHRHRAGHAPTARAGMELRNG